MQEITIPLDEYNELKRKAAFYDRIAAKNSAAGKASASKLSPAERSARAKRAVEARMAKYGQKRRTE